MDSHLPESDLMAETRIDICYRQDIGSSTLSTDEHSRCPNRALFYRPATVTRDMLDVEELNLFRSIRLSSRQNHLQPSPFDSIKPVDQPLWVAIERHVFNVPDHKRIMSEFVQQG